MTSSEQLDASGTMAPISRRGPGAGETGTRLVLITGIPLVIMALIGLVGPWLPWVEPGAQNLAARLTPPVWLEGGTWEHPLGTDHLGRDMVDRLIVGARLTLLISLGAVGIGGIFGTFVGMIAGYRRGWVDTVLSRIIDAQLAFPVILLAIAIITVRGRSIPVLIAVLAIIGWARYARIVRAEAISLRERPFILGLRAAGAPTWRILLFHILPNVLNTVIVLATLEIGTMILAESALSFLGLGVVSPQVSWGAMLAEGRQYMQTAWWVVALPGLAITAAVLLINLVGDGLRAKYDPRKRRI